MAAMWCASTAAPAQRSGVHTLMCVLRAASLSQGTCRQELSWLQCIEKACAKKCPVSFDSSEHRYTIGAISC